LPAAVAVAVLSFAAAWTGATHSSFFGQLLGSDKHSTSCVGTLAPGTYFDVSVPSGKTCTITSSDVIRHDVELGSGSTLNDVGSSVGHDVNAGPNSNLFISDSGGYSASNARIGHDLKASGANDVGREARERERDEMSGANRVSVTNTNIGHNVIVQETETSVSITNNTIGNDLTVENNEGSTTVTGNHVGHVADCDDNTAFTGGGNTAGGKDTCN